MSDECPNDDEDKFGPARHTKGRETDGKHAQDFVVNDRCKHEKQKTDEANQYHRFLSGRFPARQIARSTILP
jgi:hypothetical protein